MEGLKEILDKEGQTSEQVISDLKAWIPLHFVSKEQYTKKTTALQVAKEELGNAKSQMEETSGKLQMLSDKSDDIEGLKATISNLEESLKGSEEREKAIELRLSKEQAFERELFTAKADPNLIGVFKREAKGDIEGLVFGEDNNLAGVDGVVSKLKEKFPNSFEVSTTTDPHGKPPEGGNTEEGNSMWWLSKKQANK